VNKNTGEQPANHEKNNKNNLNGEMASLPELQHEPYFYLVPDFPEFFHDLLFPETYLVWGGKIMVEDKVSLWKTGYTGLFSVVA
jgi:hypothetical protein